MIKLKIYTVKSGDTLYALARRFGTSVSELTYANSLQNPDVLSVGQALVIPVDELRHTVQRGQTLGKIAATYGVTIDDILSANPSISNPNRIYAGQTIVIPFSGENLGDIVVNGYLTDASDKALTETLPYLSLLSPFAFRVSAQGDMYPIYNLNLNLARQTGIGVLLTLVNTRASGGFSSDVAHAILTDSLAQDNFMENIINELNSGIYYGVGLDFEYVYAFDKENYNRFVERLSGELHSRGFILITALAPKLSENQSGLLYQAHDYAFHGRYADFVVLMTYEWGYTYGPAMAVAPLNKVSQVLDYAVTVIPREKILMGIPNYGYDWTLPFVQGSAARSLSLSQAVTLAGKVGAEIRFDAVSQSPYFNYRDAEGRKHEVWFEDAKSLLAKYRLAARYGLGGVSFWNLNTLYRPIFEVMQSVFSVEKPLDARS